MDVIAAFFQFLVGDGTMGFPALWFGRGRCVEVPDRIAFVVSPTQAMSFFFSSGKLRQRQDYHATKEPLQLCRECLFQNTFCDKFEIFLEDVRGKQFSYITEECERPKTCSAT